MRPNHAVVKFPADVLYTSILAIDYLQRKSLVAAGVDKKTDIIGIDDESEPDDHYCLNDETRQIIQVAFDEPELCTLFKVARDIPPERLKAHIEFMKSPKAQEHGDNDEGC
jgi:hypothetical protein